MKKLLLVLTALSMMFVVSCASIALDATGLDSPAKLNASGEKDYTVIKSFSVNDKAGWAILGLIPANKPSGDNHQYFAELLANQVRLAGGDAVINVKVRTQNQPLDFVVNILVGAIYSIRTVTVTGDVIKYN